MNKYKKIFMDLILSVCATAIPLIALQLIILPLIAARSTDEIYGLVLTIISIATVIGTSLGNALNNVRLIKDVEYEEKKYQGDFQLLLICEIIAGFFLVIVSVSRYNLGVLDIIFIVIMTLLWIVQGYYAVAYRLKLNFKGIVINNVIMAVGYIIGYALFCISGFWELVYIIGLMGSLLYIAKTSTIMKEKVKKTPMFLITGKELVFLVIAGIIANLLNYADRMLIYPLIGGTAVSVYYASTLFGKLVSTAVVPLNSVVLSYLAKKTSMAKGMFNKAFGVSLGVACVGYVVCRIIAYPALQILYPQWAEESIKYVPITTAVAMLTMMINVLSPFVLKFCAMKWQIVINAIMLLVYIVAAIGLFSQFGLMGFCAGVLISNLVKLVIMLILGKRLA